MASENFTQYCSEIVCYKVKAGKQEEFARLHPQILKALTKLEGYVDAKTYQHTSTPSESIDIITWQDEEKAKSAYAAFRSLENSDKFSECIETVFYKGFFR